MYCHLQCLQYSFCEMYCLEKMIVSHSAINMDVLYEQFILSSYYNGSNCFMFLRSEIICISLVLFAAYLFLRCEVYVHIYLCYYGCF